MSIIQDALKQNNMSIYRLSKLSAVPYATVNDICNGKARLEKCSAETVYKIAQALKLSMEDILAPCLIKRSSFENFKSTICHKLKTLGDIDFIVDILESQNIRSYYDRKWYPESLYLLAMLDYLCRENNVPIDDEYDDIRSVRLERPVYPAGILAEAAVANDNGILKKAMDCSIPEFRRFNIIENEVRNVI